MYFNEQDSFTPCRFCCIKHFCGASADFKKKTMHETRANWALSVWVGEIEDLKGLTLAGISHIKDFKRVIMQI